MEKKKKQKIYTYEMIFCGCSFSVLCCMIKLTSKFVEEQTSEQQRSWSPPPPVIVCTYVYMYYIKSLNNILDKKFKKSMHIPFITL